jgi:hypothetical protein
MTTPSSTNLDPISISKCRLHPLNLNPNDVKRDLTLAHHHAHLLHHADPPQIYGEIITIVDPNLAHAHVRDPVVHQVVMSRDHLHVLTLGQMEKMGVKRAILAGDSFRGVRVYRLIELLFQKERRCSRGMSERRWCTAQTNVSQSRGASHWMTLGLTPVHQQSIMSSTSG